jgi:hypothetical protein
MEQKLQNLLYSLPTRTAWIIVGSCAAFWIICLTGILTPPVSAPPSLTLMWFYAMLMLVLASGLAVIGAAAVLVLKRGGMRTGPADPATAPATAADAAADAGPDQLAGLGHMMDNPGNPAERSGSPAAFPAVAPPEVSPPSPPAQTRKTPQRKRRKRRR